MRGPLPKDEFDRIYSRVPRLTVEVVIASPRQGVLLSLRDIEPCKGMWHLPGGTVRFGEPLVDAVARVASDELGLTVDVGEMLGYIEYPSHYENGLDCPVGVAFAARITGRSAADPPPAGCEWFQALPDNMHDEQKDFLAALTGPPADGDVGVVPQASGRVRASPEPVPADVYVHREEGATS